MPKQIINIFFLLIIAITSLPLKQASRCFFKKNVQEEMCSDCCDAPIKKSDDSIGFKDFPCHQHYGVVLHPPKQNILSHTMHANWSLPLWPAVEIHTPPPNQA
jgi:hypothetical protein